MQNKKRMNKGRFYLFACWLLLTACNSGIFIEEFAPGMPAEVTVQCGEPTVIHFANDDWELRSGTRYDYDFVKFTIERTAPTELTIIISSNRNCVTSLTGWRNVCPAAVRLYSQTPPRSSNGGWLSGQD